MTRKRKHCRRCGKRLSAGGPEVVICSTCAMVVLSEPIPSERIKQIIESAIGPGSDPTPVKPTKPKDNGEG